MSRMEFQKRTQSTELLLGAKARKEVSARHVLPRAARHASLESLTLDDQAEEPLRDLRVPTATFVAEVVLADGLYRYTDPAFEALSPAQKHLVRMGAANASAVREALRRLRVVVAG